MKNVGKRGIEWEKAKQKLRPLFNSLGITYCEFRGSKCWGSGDTFAHVKRRRNLGKMGSEEREVNLNSVVRLCIPCHDYIDTELGEYYGGKELERIIQNRNSTFLFADL